MTVIYTDMTAAAERARRRRAFNLRQETSEAALKHQKDAISQIQNDFYNDIKGAFF